MRLQRARSFIAVPQRFGARNLMKAYYFHMRLSTLQLVSHRKMLRRKTQSISGDVIVVRWADDFVIGFQSRAEAERCLAELKKRFEKFGLALHPEKTRLIEFGPYAAANRIRRGQGRPETFDFLGFTHICGTKRSNGMYTVVRRTASNG
jgi:hypothetical protein